MVVRAALRFGFGTASLLAGGWVLRALHGAPAALGASPAEIEAVAQALAELPRRRVRQPRSGVDDQPRPRASSGCWCATVSARASRPAGGPIPLADPRPRTPPAADLAVTGTATRRQLIEIDGYRVLADPVWSDRCSPSRTVGPQRLHEVPVPLEALPAVDAVLISHDHYDHLDIDTIMGLARTQRAPFFVPLGVGAHLRKWGIPDDRIVELDWHESAPDRRADAGLHPGAALLRPAFTRNTTLWASWVIAGPRHRAFFGGDTGYTKSFAEIGATTGLST